ncbi:MAG TPA: Ig-like domain-containing protein [Adhaeribacter sp.]|nr:Ig-like domain-containing protein [Adhaeribacter sp.]
MKKLFSLFWLCGGLLLGLVACNRFEDDVVPANLSEIKLKDDTFNGAKNLPVRLPVLENDQLGTSGNLSFRTPANGTIQSDDQGFFYKPELNFTGTDSFYYRYCTATACDSAKVTVTVTN